MYFLYKCISSADFCLSSLPVVEHTSLAVRMMTVR